MTDDIQTSPVALNASGLSFSYGANKALDQVSLQVPRGQFVALVGANGAGKSTLFSLITGLYSAHQGSIEVMGHNLRSHTLQALGSMGVVFQRSTLDLDLNIHQNLSYAAALQGIPRRKAREAIEQGMLQHGLDGLDSRKVAALSGGQRRRVELTRALLHQPSLLLLDEPTVGLDLHSRGEFVRHVKDLCHSQSTGVLWATHLMDEIDNDDLVYILEKGKIITSGKLEDLLQSHHAQDINQLISELKS